jgi:hypothetical protein
MTNRSLPAIPTAILTAIGSKAVTAKRRIDRRDFMQKAEMNFRTPKSRQLSP